MNPQTRSTPVFLHVGMFRRVALAAVLALLATLAVAVTTTTTASAAGACVVVKKNTAKQLQKRTKKVKQTRTKFNAAKKRLRTAQRNGAKKAVRVKLNKSVKQTRTRFNAAKKKRKAVVRKRKLVCAPAHRLVSVSNKGVPGNAESRDPQVSANDRYVAFMSKASNLVPGDTNGWPDVFVRDRLKRTTERVSVQSNGKQAAGGGEYPAISANGRYVAFVSSSRDLGVPGSDDFDDQPAGIFVRDRVKGTTTRASYAADGSSHFNRWPMELSISNNGRWIAFRSFATNVVPGYRPNDMISAYVVDRVNKKNYHASVTSTGAPTNGWVDDVRISGNGRFVVYTTDASNYIPGRGQKWDHKVFMWDRTTGTSRIVSVDNDGTALEMASRNPSISGNGRRVLYEKNKVVDWTPTSAQFAPESLQMYDRLGKVGSYRKQVYGRAYGSVLAPNATHMAFVTGSGVGAIQNIRTGRKFRVGGLKGQPANGGLANFSLSRGGRVLAFSSFSTNIVKKKTPEWVDQIYIRTR